MDDMKTSHVLLSRRKNTAAFPADFILQIPLAGGIGPMPTPSDHILQQPECGIEDYFVETLPSMPNSKLSIKNLIFSPLRL